MTELPRDHSRDASLPTTRTLALGQTAKFTFVDRFGIWLSTRKIAGTVGSFEKKRIGDFGCGYQAHTTRRYLGVVEHAFVIDVALADDLKSLPGVTAIEGVLPNAMSNVASTSLDIALCISVLEHLNQPETMLRELFRTLVPGGVCLINVPSWRGKRLLELSAFRLGLSPKYEMDDHKMYYNPRDLWPLLVRAGFLPSEIRISRYKFGCNTLAICKKTLTK